MTFSYVARLFALKRPASADKPATQRRQRRRHRRSSSRLKVGRCSASKSVLVLTSPFTAEVAAAAPAIVLPPQGRNLDDANLEITLSSRCFDEDKLRIVDSRPHVEAFSPAQTQFITEELRALLRSSSEILVLACDW